MKFSYFKNKMAQSKNREFSFVVDFGARSKKSIIYSSRRKMVYFFLRFCGDMRYNMKCLLKETRSRFHSKTSTIIKRKDCKYYNPKI